MDENSGCVSVGKERALVLWVWDTLQRQVWDFKGSDCVLPSNTGLGKGMVGQREMPRPHAGALLYHTGEEGGGKCRAGCSCRQRMQSSPRSTHWWLSFQSSLLLHPAQRGSNQCPGGWMQMQSAGTCEQQGKACR